MSRHGYASAVRAAWALATGLSVSVAVAPSAGAEGPYPTNSCLSARSGHVGCSANDVDIAQVQVTNGVSSYVAGTIVDVGRTSGPRIRRPTTAETGEEGTQ